ncbi:hypothetical protein KVR01_004432 [Diaporthe batatas]|uniref:uncharacterized protein n=1 Tax=Diaporthe batatas TaxID=748121 RepID=UPI001D047F07|nr:uncharacterized protein KVR01_004432 [Diaporthe batatas]KAG8165880.1 hypothetical protein KVR01_004432 [Diaporthe batatas]
MKKTKSQQPGEPQILKWSSKPASHNAARVRNNQRRHRARAREHVQDLERRLQETGARLEAALQTISHLAREVEVLRGRLPASPPPAPPPAWPLPPLPPATGVAGGEYEVQLGVQPAGPSGGPPPAEEQEPGAPGVPEPTIDAAAAAPPSSSSTEGADTGGDDDDDDNDNNNADQDCVCSGAGLLPLPPQAPGESTLPCASAFRIIYQQSFGGVEVTAVRAWLGPGFRRALRPGGACRVETGRVYELLDHVMSDS